MLTVGLREWAGHSRQRPLAPGGRAAVHELGLLSISSHVSPKLEPRDPGSTTRARSCEGFPLAPGILPLLGDYKVNVLLGGSFTEFRPCQGHR